MNRPQLVQRSQKDRRHVVGIDDNRKSVLGSRQGQRREGDPCRLTYVMIIGTGYWYSLGDFL
jgi:hypothetical protein